LFDADGEIVATAEICRNVTDRVAPRFDHETNPECTENGKVVAASAVGRELAEHLWTAEVLREQRRHFQSLLRLSKRLEAAIEYGEAVAAARDEVHAVIGYTNLWVYLLTEDLQHADVLAAQGTASGSILGDQEVARLTISGDPMLEEIAAAKGPVIIEDARVDPRCDKDIVSRLDNRTIVNIPITLPGRCLGSFGTGSFGDEGVQVPTQSELDYLVALASHMAVSLDRIRLRKEQESTTESLRLLNRKLRAISTCNQFVIRADSERDLLDEVCRIIREDAGYLLAWVGYAEDDEARSIRPMAWAGPGSGYLAELNLSWAAENPRGQGPAGCAVREGVTVVVDDIATDDRMEPWRESALQRGYLAGMALPLKDAAGKAFGVLLVYYGEVGVISPDEVALLEELAGDLAFGISTLRDRAAREEAQRQISLLSSAMNGVREAAYLLDDEAHFCYVNDEACRALGYSRDELLSMRVFDIDTEFSEERWAKTHAALQDQRLVAFETYHKAKDGRVFPVEIRSSYLAFDGNGFGLALARDISERRRAEDRLREAEKLESVPRTTTLTTRRNRRCGARHPYQVRHFRRFRVPRF
jgi:PAS domain S-box-containing protein